MPSSSSYRTWPWVVGTVIGFFVLVALIGLNDDPTPEPVFNDTTAGLSDARCERVITYFVEGTAESVSITLQNDSGNTEQADERAVPLHTADGAGLAIGSMDCGSFVYIAAQNEGEHGTVTCRIEADGVTIEKATSEGAYVIATCSGSVPSDL